MYVCMYVCTYVCMCMCVTYSSIFSFIQVSDSTIWIPVHLPYVKEFNKSGHTRTTS